MEIELKLQLDAADLEALEGDALFAKPPVAAEEQLTRYYDTADRIVEAAGFRLRVRQTARGFVQTVKPISEAAGLFDREEWEFEVGTIEPDLQALEPDALKSLAASGALAALQSVSSFTVGRRSWLVRHGGSQVQLDLDIGRAQAGGREASFVELELELRAGEAADLIDLAAQLASRVPVRIGVLTKAERGFALAEGTLGEVIKTVPANIPQKASVAESFAAIVQSCLKHYALNEPLVVEGRSASALHQCRVAMRRLRATFSLYKPAIADGQMERFRGELRTFAHGLGRARDLDVYLERDLDPAERAQRLEEREGAYDEAIAAMRSAEVRRLLLLLAGWSALGQWRSGAMARSAVVGFARKRLDRLWRSVRLDSSLEAMSPDARHRLRIQFKKLRYAVEFLRGTLSIPGKRRRSFGQAIEAVQEELGKLNDISTAQSLTGLDPAWLIRPQEGREHLAAAEQAYRQLMEVGRVWRGAGKAEAEQATA